MARDFHELSWLLLNVKKQKGWMKMVIFLHLIISNKNLLQPPACLQDFLFCLTTSIFKLAEFLSVRNFHSHWHCSQSHLPVLPCSGLWVTFPHTLWSCCYLMSVSPVPPEHMLCATDWHKGTKSRNMPQFLLPSSRLQSRLDFSASYFLSTSYCCSYFKPYLHIWLLQFAIVLDLIVEKTTAVQSVSW